MAGGPKVAKLLGNGQKWGLDSRRGYRFWLRSQMGRRNCTGDGGPDRRVGDTSWGGRILDPVSPLWPHRAIPRPPYTAPRDIAFFVGARDKRVGADVGEMRCAYLEHFHRDAIRKNGTCIHPPIGIRAVSQRHIVPDVPRGAI